MDSIKERLREAFGSDSQETIGKNLNMTQGNVSKLLSGAQQPTVDTLLRIANVYDVSIDWLMGLSDRKKVIKPETGTTYGLAVETIQDLLEINYPSDKEVEDFNSKVSPLLNLIGCVDMENQRLQALRDTLLPKLMSGELDVSELDI